MLAAERGAARNTLMAYQADLDDFAAFAAARGQPPAQCDAALLQAYMAGLHRVGLAARTAARRLSALRQFHRFLLREGVRTDDPTTLLDAPRLPRTLPKYLSEQEVEALLDCREASSRAARRTRSGGTGDPLRDRTAGVGTAGIATPSAGQRCRGAADPRQRRQGAHRAAVRQGEAGRRRTGGASKTASGRHLFPGRDPRRTLTRQAFFLLLRQVALEAGLDPARVSPHVLRHSFASHLLAHGADLRSLQLLLGHADIATTQIYTHVLAERLQRLVEAHHPLARRFAVALTPRSPAPAGVRSAAPAATRSGTLRRWR